MSMTITVAFKEIAPELRAQAFILTHRNDTETEELVQQTFVNAVRFWHRYDSNRPLRLWLHRILRNLWIDNHKYDSSQRMASIDDEHWHEGYKGNNPNSQIAMEPDRLLVAAAVQNEVRRAIFKLQEPRRSALILVYMQGLTYHEAARVMRITLGVFRGWLNRARKEMAASINAQFLTVLFFLPYMLRKCCGS